MQTPYSLIFCNICGLTALFYHPRVSALHATSAQPVDQSALLLIEAMKLMYCSHCSRCFIVQR